MQPPKKRPRIDQSGENIYELFNLKARSNDRLKNAFESIFEKYDKDFSGIGDEVDLEAEEIVVDNGHIGQLKDSDDDDMWREEKTKPNGRKGEKRRKNNQTTPFNFTLTEKRLYVILHAQGFSVSDMKSYFPGRDVKALYSWSNHTAHNNPLLMRALAIFARTKIDSISPSGPTTTDLTAEDEFEEEFHSEADIDPSKDGSHAWSKDEDARLIRLSMAKLKYAEMALFFFMRPPEQLRSRLFWIAQNKPEFRSWVASKWPKQDEDSSSLCRDDLAEQISRDLDERHNLFQHRPWSALEDDLFICLMSHRVSLSFLSTIFHRSKTTIQQRSQDLHERQKLDHSSSSEKQQARSGEPAEGSSNPLVDPEILTNSDEESESGWSADTHISAREREKSAMFHSIIKEDSPGNWTDSEKRPPQFSGQRSKDMNTYSQVSPKGLKAIKNVSKSASGQSKLLGRQNSSHARDGKDADIEGPQEKQNRDNADKVVGYRNTTDVRVKRPVGRPRKKTALSIKNASESSKDRPRKSDLVVPDRILEHHKVQHRKYEPTVVAKGCKRFEGQLNKSHLSNSVDSCNTESKKYIFDDEDDGESFLDDDDANDNDNDNSNSNSDDPDLPGLPVNDNQFHERSKGRMRGVFEQTVADTDHETSLSALPSSLDLPTRPLRTGKDQGINAPEVRASSLSFPSTKLAELNSRAGNDADKTPKKKDLSAGCKNPQIYSDIRHKSGEFWFKMATPRSIKASPINNQNLSTITTTRQHEQDSEPNSQPRSNSPRPSSYSRKQQHKFGSVGAHGTIGNGKHQEIQVEHIRHQLTPKKNAGSRTRDLKNLDDTPPYLKPRSFKINGRPRQSLLSSSLDSAQAQQLMFSEYTSLQDNSSEDELLSTPQ